MRIIMARPIRETPVLKGEDAFNFEMRRLEVEHMSKEQRAENRRKFEARVAEAKKYINVCIWFMILVRLTPDYLSAVPFYEKNGFLHLTKKDEDEHTRLMYFDMMEIADWFHITNTPYAMPHRERLNNANGAKRVTDSFGHSNIFATLSQWPSTADNDNTNNSTFWSRRNGLKGQQLIAQGSALGMKTEQ